MAVARNDITNDKLISRGLSKEGEDNWDRIFGKKKTTVAEATPTADQPVESTQMDLFDEERIDIIGPNGNEGLHYEEQ